MTLVVERWHGTHWSDPITVTGAPDVVPLYRLVSAFLRTHPWLGARCSACAEWL